MGLLEKRYGPCAHGHPNIECIFFEDFPTMSTKKPKLFFALEKSTYNENGVYGICIKNESDFLYLR